MSDISFTFTGFLIIGAAIIAALIAYLYYRKYTLIPKPYYYIAGIARAITLFIIGLILINPIINSTTNDIIKPDLYIAIDQSKSVKKYLSPSKAEETILRLNTLSKEYNITTVSFDAKVNHSTSMVFNGPSSNFEQLFNYLNASVNTALPNKCILISDGIANEGSALEDQSIPFNTNIYTLGIGDSTAKKDISIEKLRYSSPISQGKNQIEIYLKATQLKGRNATLLIKVDGKKTTEQTIRIANNTYNTILPIWLNHLSEGSKSVSVEVVPQSEESNVFNNVKSFIQEVKNTQKIFFLISDTPHPDLAVIQQSINENPILKCKLVTSTSFMNDTAKNIGGILVHQLNNEGLVRKIIEKAEKKSTGIGFFLSHTSNFNLYNKLLDGYTIKTRNNSSIKECYAFIKASTTALQSEKFSLSTFQSFTPLEVPFAEYAISTNWDNVLTQRIGKTETDFPVLSLGSSAGKNTFIFTGDGLWRWRLRDYQLNKNTNTFNELLYTILNHLESVNNSNQSFTFSFTKNVYYNTENVQGIGKVNDTKLGSTLSLTINNELVPLIANEGRFEFESSTLKPGNYTWEVKESKTNTTKKGQFTILPVELESEQTQANFAALRTISSKSGGKFETLDNIDSIVNVLRSSAPKNIIKSTSILKDLISFWALLPLLLISLSIEWFIRKYFGGY